MAAIGVDSYFVSARTFGPYCTVLAPMLESITLKLLDRTKQTICADHAPYEVVERS